MPVIAVAGQTATGKTALGVELAKRLNTEVISADSQLVYRHLDIGTAKPTEEEIQGISHHMIDLVSPTEEFSVARYQNEASPVLKKLFNQSKSPVVVGGTGFYFRALLQEKFYPDVAPDENFRSEMRQLSDESPEGYLHGLLTEKDPERAADLHPNDHVRIIRALEIIHHTGQPVPVIQEKTKYPVIWVGLHYEDRDYHRSLIDERIDKMVEAGWIDEVEALMNQYGADAHALQVAHGYPEWVAHLQNKMTFHDAREQIRINIHQYSRRQVTFFKKNESMQWFDVGVQSLDEIVNQLLEDYNVMVLG